MKRIRQRRNRQIESSRKKLLGRKKKRKRAVKEVNPRKNFLSPHKTTGQPREDAPEY